MIENDKLEKMNAFDEAVLYLNMKARSKDKNKLRRTARNRSYKNIKEKYKEQELNENMSIKEKRRTMMRNQYIRRVEKEKPKEKPKINIDLENVYDDFEADVKQNITINANKNNNKTLKNAPFRRIRMND